MRVTRTTRTISASMLQSSYGDGFHEERKEGLQEGIEQGLQQGLEQGRQAEKQAIARSLIGLLSVG